MKITFDGEYIIIYINKLYKSIDFNDIESSFKELFLKLRNRYNLILNGYYVIDIYNDKNYGSIFKIRKEELEYIDYYDDQVDMKITIHNDKKILFEIDDYILFKNLNYIKLKKINNKIYAEIIDDIDAIKLGNFIEYTKSFILN